MSARSKEDGPDAAAASAEAASAAATSSATEAGPSPASLGAGGAAPAAAAGSGAQPPSLGGAPAPGEKKKHPWRPPRLGDSFQAVVPAFGQGAEVSNKRGWGLWAGLGVAAGRRAGAGRPGRSIDRSIDWWIRPTE